jgi:hypothetical protein
MTNRTRAPGPQLEERQLGPMTTKGLSQWNQQIPPPGHEIRRSNREVEDQYGDVKIAILREEALPTKHFQPISAPRNSMEVTVLSSSVQ